MSTSSAQPAPTDTSTISTDWIIGLPKAENHVHLEGCIDPGVLERAARRVGQSPIGGPATNLDELLHMNDHNCSLLTTSDDLQEAAHARADAAKAQGICYTDLIINPSHWPAWAHRLDEMIDALDRGFSASEDNDHIARTRLLLSIGRHQDSAAAHRVVDAVLGAPAARMAGISIDGNESAPGAGRERFSAAVARARDAGKYIAVHTGESGGPEAVWANLTLFNPDRIDHGVRSIEDPALVTELARRGTTLAICPTSNTVLGIVPNLHAHPIDRLRRAGVPVTINTDDPLVFGTDLVREYTTASAHFGWSAPDLKHLARTSIECSAAPESLKRELLHQLATYPLPHSSTSTR